jgi:hypothetical protein
MSDTSSSTTVQLSNPAYDQLKRISTVVLPGLSALYFTLAQIWGLPAAEQVVGTIAAVNLFVGVLINFSSKAYNGPTMYDGVVDIEPTAAGGKGYSLVLNGSPEDLDNKAEVRFKVNNTF